jgi:ankyrin repeat protein
LNPFYFQSQNLSTAKRCHVNLADNLSRTALHWAAQLGRADFIQELIDGDVDVHAQDCNGATALHYAAAAGDTSNHQTSIQLLLQHGVNVDVKDETGATPLMWAASRGADFAIEKVLEL